MIFLIEIVSDDIIGQYRTLRTELEQHSPAFKQKPRLLVLSKADLTENIPDIVIDGVETSVISAVTGSGLDNLIRQIVQRLENDG